jgi:hypothetical protein
MNTSAETKGSQLSFSAVQNGESRFTNRLLLGVLLAAMALMVFVLNRLDVLPAAPTIILFGLLVGIVMAGVRVIMLEQMGAKEAGIILDANQLIERNAPKQTRIFTYDQIYAAEPFYRGGIKIRYYPIANGGSVSNSEIREAHLIQTDNRAELVQELQKRIRGAQPSTAANSSYARQQLLPLLMFLASGFLMAVVVVIINTAKNNNPNFASSPLGLMLILLGWIGGLGLFVSPMLAYLYINRYGGVASSKS